MDGGGADGLFALTRIPKGGSEMVKVTQVSGEKITHSDFITSGPNVEFMTMAEGVGVIKTEIPKTMIPEAKAWLTYMLAYSYRFSRAVLTLGVCGSQNSAGVFGSGSYWI